RHRALPSCPARRSSDLERAKALGWLSAATSAGVIVGPGLASLAARWGETVPGLVAAGLCALNVIFAWRWLPESRVWLPHATTASSEEHTSELQSRFDLV